MTAHMQLLLCFGIVYAVLFLCRCFLKWEHKEIMAGKDDCIGIAQTMGSCQIQADAAQIWKNDAGVMAVIADGIGSANTGKVCAQIAADTILDRFETYSQLKNPLYFFKTSFLEASRRIQRTIGERRGGASAAAVFLNHTHLYYAIAGDVRVALLRGGEIIPLSKGQTFDVLAAQAYENGKISKQDMLWSMSEKKIWNYLGQDGFHEIEVCVQPILLKPEDKILMLSKGIFEELSWREIEDILQRKASAQQLADAVIEAAEKKNSAQKDNGSVILIQGWRLR